MSLPRFWRRTTCREGSWSRRLLPNGRCPGLACCCRGKGGKLMSRNQVVLGVVPSSSGKSTMVSVSRAGNVKARGPLLLSISVVALVGGSTRLARATKTSDRSRMYCISRSRSVENDRLFNRLGIGIGRPGRRRFEIKGVGIGSRVGLDAVIDHQVESAAANIRGPGSRPWPPPA